MKIPNNKKKLFLFTKIRAKDIRKQKKNKLTNKKV